MDPTEKPSTQPTRLRWAQLRLMVIGPLLAAPPESGKLQERFSELAETSWRHPTTGKPKKFGVSTIERWYYAARGNEQDPALALERKTHALAGQSPASAPQPDTRPRASARCHHATARHRVAHGAIAAVSLPRGMAPNVPVSLATLDSAEASRATGLPTASTSAPAHQSLRWRAHYHPARVPPRSRSTRPLPRTLVDQGTVTTVVASGVDSLHVCNTASTVD